MASHKSKRCYCEVCLLLLGLVVGCWIRNIVLPVSNDQCKGRVGQGRFPLGFLSNGSEDGVASRREPDDLLMIGVMTTRPHIATRAASIFATWGQSVPGKIVFYVGESDDGQRDGFAQSVDTQRPLASSFSDKDQDVNTKETVERKWRDLKYGNELSVVELPGIRDSAYPPRSKSFAMLRHMHVRYGGRFKWFMRADDDVFVRTDLLAAFLSSLNNKHLLYIGQPGTGKGSERGKLGLKKGAPYCMGGPGVFLSSQALGRLAPHLPRCENQVVTSHEDSELGRCVQRFLNLPCTKSLQMQRLFYQNYVRMNSSFAGPLDPNVFSALTLHPVKDMQQMFRLQVIFDMLKLGRLQLKHHRLLTARDAFSDLLADVTTDEKSSTDRVPLERRSGDRKLFEYSGNSEQDETKGPARLYGYSDQDTNVDDSRSRPVGINVKQSRRRAKEPNDKNNEQILNDDPSPIFLGEGTRSRKGTNEKEVDSTPSGRSVETRSLEDKMEEETGNNERRVRDQETSNVSSDDREQRSRYVFRKLMIKAIVGMSAENDFVLQKLPAGTNEEPGIDSQISLHPSFDTTSAILNGLSTPVTAPTTAKRSSLISDDDAIWDVYAVNNSIFFLSPQLHPARKLALLRAQRYFKEYSRSGLFGEDKYRGIAAMCQRMSVTQGLQHLLTVFDRKGYRNFLVSVKYDDLLWRELAQPLTWQSQGKDGISHSSHNGTKSEQSNSGIPFSLSMPGEIRTTPLQHIEIVSGGPATAEGQTERGKSFPERFQTGPGPSKLSVYKTLWILLPLFGRHETYKQFLDHLSSAAQRYPGMLHLKVALFLDPANEHLKSAGLTQQRVSSAGNLEVTLLEMNGSFSRAHALQMLSVGLAESSQLVLMDVDLILTHHFLKRAAANAGPGRAYFPVYLAQYHPDTVCYRSSPCTRPLFDFSRDAGTWRHFSYGVAVLMAGDLRRAGGLDTSIRGWGKEDVDLYTKCVSHGLEIVRAIDPGLLHVHHQRSCDPTLAADQLSMCRSSLAALYGSVARLAQMVIDIEANSNITMHS